MDITHMEITQKDIPYMEITLKDITCMEITQKDITCMDITYGDHASKRNVMLTETKSEKNVQRLTLQVRGMYKGWILQMR